MGTNCFVEILNPKRISFADLTRFEPSFVQIHSRVFFCRSPNKKGTLQNTPVGG